MAGKTTSLGAVHRVPGRRIKWKMWRLQSVVNDVMQVGDEEKEEGDWPGLDDALMMQAIAGLKAPVRRCMASGGMGWVELLQGWTTGT